MVVLGNLGTVRMIYQGLQRMAAPGGMIDDGNIVQRLVWAAQGVGRLIGGASAALWPGRLVLESQPRHPAGPGQRDHRVPILHIPVQRPARAHAGHAAGVAGAGLGAFGHQGARAISLFRLLIGALAIGALYPTNLSDIYTYLPIGFAVLAYTIWRSRYRGRLAARPAGLAQEAGS